MKRLQGMISGVNAAALDAATAEDGWYLIAPYGEWPTADKKLIQVFGREQAEAMVAHYNSVPFRLDRWLLSNEVPVTIGHPREDPKVYTDHRLLAPKHLALEARADGLWGQAAWNSLGKENLSESYWRYPSPVWLYKAPKKGTNRVYPDILRSVGLTNFPNSPDAAVVTANGGAMTADDAGEINNEEPYEDNNDDDMNGLKPEEVAAIIAALELEEGAGAAEIMEAIAALREAKQAATAEEDAAMEAANAATGANDGTVEDGAADDGGGEELSAANDALALTLETVRGELSAANALLEALETANAALAEGREAAVNAIVTLAIESGRATGADEETLRVSLLEAEDFAVAANAVLERQPTGLDRAGVTLGRETVLLDSREHRRAAWNAALATVAEERGLSLDSHRDQIWQATKQDPRFSRIWDAMESAGKG